MRRLMRELKVLRTSPLGGIRIQPNKENVLDFVGIIEDSGESFRKVLYTHDLVLTRLRRGHPIPMGNIRL